jgi:hypothetical protein
LRSTTLRRLGWYLVIAIALMVVDEHAFGDCFFLL